MTKEAEREFLSKVLEETRPNAVIDARFIQEAYEKRLGHAVRHGDLPPPQAAWVAPLDRGPRVDGALGRVKDAEGIGPSGKLAGRLADGRVVII